MEGRVVLDKTTGRIPAFLPLIVWAAYQLVLSKFNQNNYESANNNKKRKGERRKTEEQKNTNGRGRDVYYIVWSNGKHPFCELFPWRAFVSTYRLNNVAALEIERIRYDICRCSRFLYNCRRHFCCCYSCCSCCCSLLLLFLVVVAVCVL